MAALFCWRRVLSQSLVYRKVILIASSHALVHFRLYSSKGVSYFRVRRQLDLSHVDPRVGPDRTVAAREAGNLVVVDLPSRAALTPPWHRGQFVWNPPYVPANIRLQ